MKNTVSSILVLASLWVVTSNYSHGQKTFSGPFFDVTTSRENVIGGALVNGIDYLSQETRSVVSLGVGYRFQVQKHFVLGAGVSTGWLDGDLNHNESLLDIDWENKTQFSWEIDAGFAPNDRMHIFLFGSKVTRKFDVDLNFDGTPFTQKDEERVLHWGLGAEFALASKLSAHLKLSTSRADFGDEVTNIEIERATDVSLGLRYNLFGK